MPVLDTYSFDNKCYVILKIQSRGVTEFPFKLHFCARYKCALQTQLINSDNQFAILSTKKRISQVTRRHNFNRRYTTKEMRVDNVAKMILLPFSASQFKKLKQNSSSPKKKKYTFSNFIPTCDKQPRRKKPTRVTRIVAFIRALLSLTCNAAPRLTLPSIYFSVSSQLIRECNWINKYFRYLGDEIVSLYTVELIEIISYIEFSTKALQLDIN